MLAGSGAAILVPDGELTTERLEAELCSIIDDPVRRESMATAMRANAHLDAAERVAELVEEQARG